MLCSLDYIEGIIFEYYTRLYFYIRIFVSLV